MSVVALTALTVFGYKFILSCFPKLTSSFIVGFIAHNALKLSAGGAKPINLEDISALDDVTDTSIGFKRTELYSLDVAGTVKEHDYIVFCVEGSPSSWNEKVSSGILAF